MKRKESSCVGCYDIGLHCIGSGCRNYGYYDVLVCDECGDDSEELYKYEGSEICRECLLNKFDKIV